MRRFCTLFGAFMLGLSVGRAQISVPAEPASTAKPFAFHDTRYGVRFEVPPGWTFGRKDHQVSTFHIASRSASRWAQMRGVASMTFNPFPYSTFSGAWFYFSVTPHSNNNACAVQATHPRGALRDVQTIGGMDFRHGHDEQAKMCVEVRDDVYTAYRKGSCYRFDLTVTTFCAISSGAQEVGEKELGDIRERFDGILDSVVFDWRPVERQ